MHSESVRERAEPGDQETRKSGDQEETRRLGDPETRKPRGQKDKKIKRTRVAKMAGL